MTIVVVLAVLIGVVAGLRSLTAPAVVSWAAHLGWLHLTDTSLAFLAYTWTPWILTVLALVELVADQVPTIPSRTEAVPFGARIVTGALSGAAIGAAAGWLIVGGIAGVIGAVIGTYGGAMARAKLAATFHRDMPGAFLEDALAILPAIAIVMLAQ